MEEGGGIEFPPGLDFENPCPRIFCSTHHGVQHFSSSPRETKKVVNCGCSNSAGSLTNITQVLMVPPVFIPLPPPTGLMMRTGENVSTSKKIFMCENKKNSHASRPKAKGGDMCKHNNKNETKIFPIGVILAA